jgi:protein SCO1/2
MQQKSGQSVSLQRLCGALLAIALASPFLLGCGPEAQWHATDITGSLPALDFTLTRADDGKTVTANDFKGDVILLYFGYTFCPDICPLTLSNLSLALKQLGDKAKDVRVLFVTVDPDRDTLAVLKDYTAAFGPHVIGLRGDADQLAALAKRYRVAYSVTPATDDTPYTVNHSPAIYVFDETGRARLLISSMATANADIDGTAADIDQLVNQQSPPSFWQRLLELV